MRAINLELPRARRILDFGCGTGWVLAEAQGHNDTIRVGIDFSFEAVRTGKQQRNSINFVAGDGLHLPFVPGSFDIVIGHVSMPYMNTFEALREIHRVLAPGGSMLLTFHSFTCVLQRFWISMRRGNWKDVIFSTYIALNGALNHLSLPQVQAPWRHDLFETVNTPTGVAKSARESGFTMISIEQEPSRIFFVVTARKPNFESGEVLPSPGWSAHCPLAQSLI